MSPLSASTKVKQDVFILVCGTLLIVVLITYGAFGFLMRPEADDFCYAIRAENYGVFGAVSYYYQMNFGRYAMVALTGVLSHLGTLSYQISPALVIIGLVTAAQYFLRPVTRNALLLSLSGVFAFIQVLPDVWGTLYWQSAAFTYIVPLILVLLLGGLIQRRASVLLLIPAGLVAVGFNEGVSIALDVSLAMVWFAFPKYRRHTAWVLAAALFGTAIMVLAPGNVVRAAAFTYASVRPHWLVTLYFALHHGMLNLVPLTAGGLGALLVAGAVTTLSISRRPRRLTRCLIFTLFFILVLITISGAALAPVIWASGALVGRVLAPNAFVLVIFVSILFSILNWRMPKPIVIGLLTASVVSTLIFLSTTAPAMADYARAFDAGLRPTTFGEIVGLAATDREPACQHGWELLYQS